MQMKLQVNHIIHDTRVEGPGLRTCIFLQGCLKKCSGCNSPQTWPLNGGREYEMKQLCEEILKNSEIEGITFSGGEPFLQSKALYHLGLILKEDDLGIVTFTGYPYELIKKVNDSNWNNLLSITDLLISEPFVEEEKTTNKIWVGSENQQYHFLSTRYVHYREKLEKMKNKIEIRLNKDGSLIVNGMGDNKKIKEIFKNL